MEISLLELIDKLPDAVVILSPGGEITHWLGKSRELFNLTPEEARGRPLKDLLKIPEKEFHETDEFSRGLLYTPPEGETRTIRIVKTFSLETGPLAHSRIWIFRDVTNRVKVDQFMNTYYDDVHHELEKIVKEKTSDLRKLNEELEERVLARTRELEKAQQKLITQAHQSGMAEIAIGTLHHIGNILNNIVTSIFIIDEILEENTIGKLKKAIALLKNKFDEYVETRNINIAEYELLLNYFLKVEEKLSEEISSIHKMNGRLGDKTLNINQIILEQSRYANSLFHTEEIFFNELLDEVLFNEEYLLEENKTTVIKCFSPVPKINSQKMKCRYILSTLLHHSVRTMKNLPRESRKLTITIKEEKRKILVLFESPGKGLEPESVKKIFSQGFASPQVPDAFKLHICANYMVELNGKINASSEGTGKGIRFMLYFNLDKETD